MTNLFDIEIKVSGLKLKNLPNIINEVLETSKDEAATVLFNRNRTRFQQQQDPDGKKWPPSAAALKRQAGGFTVSNGRRVTGGQTLFATGRLFQSITIGRAGPDRRVFTDVEYAARHHFGIGQVERRILGVSEDDAVATQTVLVQQLNKALARN